MKTIPKCLLYSLLIVSITLSRTKFDIVSYDFTIPVIRLPQLKSTVTVWFRYEEKSNRDSFLYPFLLLSLFPLFI